MRVTKFGVRQKLLTYLMLQLVARHHENSCDTSTSACNKIRLIRVRTKNYVYHILSIARTGPFNASTLKVFHKQISKTSPMLFLYHIVFDLYESQTRCIAVGLVKSRILCPEMDLLVFLYYKTG